MNQFEAEILADSVNVCGDRLVTFKLKYPRFIHAELLTHRMFSRNSASSRAIPVQKMLTNIEDDPVIPIHWGKNQKGMQADFEIENDDQIKAQTAWLVARDNAVKSARELMQLGVHKQIANRIVEPFMWITVIVSTTSFKHFRNLRVSPHAEPHFQKIAGMMADLYDNNSPKELKYGECHLPLTGFPGDEDFCERDLLKLSVARCARVSYLTHDGKRDPHSDFDLHDRLLDNKHWSPFEHAARAQADSRWHGNFKGFMQYRKFYTDEFVDD